MNSRGAHWVDPTGVPERELADKFRKRTEEVENAGYHRLAVTVKGIAASYERRAQEIIDEYSVEKQLMDVESF